jgi:pimeloyl-ACP methyl ester carboxylesterase
LAKRPRSTGARAARRPALAVDETGRGAPLVLVHGLATTRQIWSPVVGRLARRRRVVTLDLPGFGESPAVGPGFELEAVAEQVARAIAAHGVKAPFDLAGHSLGAAVALTLAARRPKLISRLVLVAPAGFQPVPGPVSVLAPGLDALFAARRRLAPLTDLAVGRRLLLTMAVADGAAIGPTQARLMVQASAGASRTAAAFQAVAGGDLRPLLTRTHAPLGLIWGDRDRTIPPRTARLLLDARPDGRLELIPGAGHVPMVERPSEFAAALERLLRTLPRYATTAHRQPPKLR